MHGCLALAAAIVAVAPSRSRSHHRARGRNLALAVATLRKDHVHFDGTVTGHVGQHRTSCRTGFGGPNITAPNGINAVPDNEALQAHVSWQSSGKWSTPAKWSRPHPLPGPFRQPASPPPPWQPRWQPRPMPGNSTVTPNCRGYNNPPISRPCPHDAIAKGWSVMWSMTHIHPWVVSHSTSGVALSMFFQKNSLQPHPPLFVTCSLIRHSGLLQPWSVMRLNQ